MRTGRWLSTATLQIVANCSSRRLPVPTLPGLMRYLSSARAHVGIARQQQMAVVVEVADERRRAAGIEHALLDLGHRRGRLGHVDRDADHLGAGFPQLDALSGRRQPASAVSVMVIDWTTTGASPPTVTDPTLTGTVRCRLDTWITRRPSTRRRRATAAPRPIGTARSPSCRSSRRDPSRRPTKNIRVTGRFARQQDRPGVPAARDERAATARSARVHSPSHHSWTGCPVCSRAVQRRQGRRHCRDCRRATRPAPAHRARPRRSPRSCRTNSSGDPSTVTRAGARRHASTRSRHATAGLNGIGDSQRPSAADHLEPHAIRRPEAALDRRHARRQGSGAGP